MKNAMHIIYNNHSIEFADQNAGKKSKLPRGILKLRNHKRSTHSYSRLNKTKCTDATQVLVEELWGGRTSKIWGAPLANRRMRKSTAKFFSKINIM